MMRYISALLLILAIHAPGARAALSEADRQTFPPSYTLIQNGGFEQGKAKWTASAGTFTTQASTLFAGNASASWAVTAATGSLSQDVTPVVAVTGASMEASCWVNTTATTFQVCSRLAGVETQCSPVPSSGTWQKVSLNFSAPSSGSMGVDVSTTASTNGTVFVDQCYVGSATNLAQVKQAQLLGAVSITGCAAAWNTTSTIFADFGTQTGCTYTAIGAAQAPSTNIPAIKFSSIPPGELVLQYEGTALAATTNKSAYYQFFDGTNVSREITNLSSSAGSVNIGGFMHSIAYTTTQSNVTLSIRGKADSGGTTDLFGTTGLQGVIKVYFFPSQSQTVLGPDSTASSWSGGVTGCGSSPSASSTGSFIDFNLPASCAVSVIGTPKNLSAVTIGSTGASITVTPVKTGNHHIEVTMPLENTAIVTTLFRLVDGSGSIIDQSNMSPVAANTRDSIHLSGLYNFTNLSPVTFKVQTQASSGTVSNNGNTYYSTWKIFQTDAAQPAPLTINSVTSNSSGLERIERVSIANSGSCSITSQSGSWVSSVSHPSTGECDLTVTSGQFSAPPTCACMQNSSPSVCSYAATSTTTSIKVQTKNANTNTFADIPFDLICMGPR